MDTRIARVLRGEGDNYIFPFLWLHGEDEETLRHYLNVIFDAGMKAVCVESRPHPDFAGKGWWHDMDIIIDEAKRLGMRVWILDDSHFPTGYANGALKEGKTELCRQSIVRKVIPCKEGGKLMELLPADYRTVPEWSPNLYEQFQLMQGSLRTFDDDKLLCIIAIKEGGRADNDIVVLTPDNDGVVRFVVPSGEWKIEVIYLTRNRGAHRDYINMMIPASCDQLIQAVYEPHYRRYKKEFGKTIAGFFSDEPELGNGHLYEYGKRLSELDDLAWSNLLEEKLKKRWGATFEKKVALLWEESFSETEKASVRYDYMDELTRLVQVAFSEQIGAWCSAHGVEYIGHLIEDNNQHTRTGSGLGHFFRAEAGQDMSGIDDIGGQVLPQGEWSGAYGLLGEHRNGLFYHYVLGKLGASAAAIDPRKNGCAMCEIFGNYGWEEGVRLEKYLIDHFLVRGINHFVPHAFSPKQFPDPDCPPHFYAHGNNPQYRHFGALMRYTNRVCEIMGGRHRASVAVLYHAESEWMGDYTAPEEVVKHLAERQIDYDFLPADVFSEREKYQTRLGHELSVNQRNYRALIIPYSQFIPSSVAKAADRLREEGCTVFFLEKMPQGIYDGKNVAPMSRNDYPVVSAESMVEFLDSRDIPEIKIAPSNKYIRCLHDITEDSKFMFVNEGTEMYEGTIEVEEVGECYGYDAWGNRIFPVKATSTEKGTRLEIKIYPLKPLIVVFGHAEFPIIFGHDYEGLDWSDGWKRSICRSKEYPNFHDGKEVFLPDKVEVEYPKFSGFVRYEKEYVHNGDEAILEITDAHEGVELFVNDKSLGIQIAPPFRYDLTGFLMRGTNHIRIEVATTLERELSDLPDPLRDHLGLGPKVPACPSGINGKVFIWNRK